MKFRNVLPLLLVLCMVITLLPVGAYAETVVSGSCGTNVSWKIDGDRLYISGAGRMEDYTQGNTPWDAYKDTIYGVEIGSGITYIGDYAFDSMGGMQILTLNEGLTTIGDYAFSNCPYLMYVTLPNSVVTIGNGVFQNSPEAIVTMGSSLRTIGDGAFEGTAMLAANLPESVTTIGSRAFANCPNLWMVKFRKNVQKLGDEAFSDCNVLEEIQFDGNAPAIGEEAFSGVTATVYYLKDNITWTENTRQNYGGTLTYVGVTSPKITSGDCGQAGYDVIWTLTEDGTLVISGSGPMADINKYSSNSSGNLVYAVYWRSYFDQITTVVIEDGVTYIGDHNFYGISALTSVIIADSVTEIGDQVFSCCPKLENVSFGSGLTKTGIEIFSDCDSLTGVTLPDADVDYGKGIFYGCDNLTSVTIPESQTSISSQMFQKCGNLTQIDIPESVTSIGGKAFAQTGLTSIDIPDSVTTLGTAVFYNCDNLRKVEIPASVTEIPNELFWHCDSLSEVIFPVGITEIGSDIISYCANLTEITVPYTVTEMRQSFSAATGLKYVFFQGDAPQMGNIAFDNITVTAYYPQGNDTWTDDVMLNYGGTVTWTSYEFVCEDHFYASEIIPPTCTEQGYTIQTCAICGDSYVSDYTDMLPHTPGEIQVENEAAATCSTKGSYDEVIYCTTCGIEMQRVTVETGTLPHTYESSEVEATCEEPGGILHTCTVCGDTYLDKQTDTLGHVYERGFCTVCGKPERALGDVNGDGEIDILDANLVVTYYNEIASLTEEQLKAADVNGDGEVDIMDANMIVAYYNEIIDSFPAQKE